MSHHHEEGFLHYTCKTSAPANEIALMGAEGTPLEPDIERNEQAEELQEWIDRFLLNKEHALNSIDSISAFWVPPNRKTEWHQELDAIDPNNAEAKLELQSLVVKVRTLRSAATDGQKWGTPVESVPFLDSVRHEKLKRKIDETRVSCLKSGLEVIESSLQLLVSLCEAVQTMCNSARKFHDKVLIASYVGHESRHRTRLSARSPASVRELAHRGPNSRHGSCLIEPPSVNSSLISPR